jgi:hypothetical protein
MTLLLLAVLATLSSLHAGIPEQVATANNDLRSGHPLDALARYRTLLTDTAFLTKEGSPELWYNSGLAEEKTGDAAAASLSFRRALLLDPGFAPAQRQLAVVLGALGLPIPSDWCHGVYAIIHPERLMIIGAVFGWIGTLLFVVLLLNGPRKKGLILISLLLLIAGHGSAIFGALIDPRRTAVDQAVIISKTGPTLRATPSDNGAPAGTIPPGTVISVLSRNGAWWYVAAGPGQTGWISSDTVTSLLPTAPASASGKGS